jgi:tetratricopeptide (TPR) repeat protein
MSELRAQWVAGHGAYKHGLRAASCGAGEAAAGHYSRAVVIYPRHAAALAGLGRLSWNGSGTERSPARAVRLLSVALHADPGLDDARLHLAISLDYVGRRDEARAAFEHAVKLDPYPPVTAVRYARAVAGWGLLDEAATRFERILRRRPNNAYAMTEFARALLIEDWQDAPASAVRALLLCASAVALDRENPAAHYFLALALHRTGGDRQRAVAHLRSALRLQPEHAAAEALLEELQSNNLV